MVQIEIILSCKPLFNASKVWRIIVSNHVHEFAGEKVVDGFSGKVINFSDVSEYLLKNEANSFFIELKKGSIEFSYVADLEFTRLDIKNLCLSKASAEKWVSPIVNEPAFVQARLYDGDYDRWQNMENISYYESEGRDHYSLPKKSNGLPFPLESEVIDIAGNPGRWELKKGYIESIGSTMWINKALLANLEAGSLATEIDNGLHVSDLGQVLKLEVQTECFRVATGEEAETQNRLRKALFKK